MTGTKNYSDIEAWLAGVTPQKLAALADPGDGGKPVSTGERASENSADVKKQTTSGNSIDGGTDNPVDGKADKPIEDSGLKQTTVGKMPGVEDAVKTITGESDKAGSAKLDTDEGLAEGLAALAKAAAAMPVLIAAAGGIAHSPAAAPSARPTQTAPAAQDPAPLGYASKEAADKAAAATVENFRLWGDNRGELVSAYLLGLHGTYNQLKQAAEDGSLEHALAQDAGGGAPGGDAGGAPQGPPPEMAGGAPPEMAGASAAPPGAPPGGDAGGMPPEGGAGGGAPTADDMAAAFMEMGLTPEEVEAAAAKMRQGVGGAEAPEETKAAIDFELARAIKTARDVRAHMRSGKFQLKPAADGTPERKGRETAKAYLRELMTAAA